MKLKRFKQKDPKKTGIILFTVVCVLLVAGVFFYTSFATFQVQEEFNIIQGEVQDPGDLYFVFYVDGEISRTMPQKGDGYVLDYESTNCTNGASVELDESDWFVKVLNMTITRTKCSLYFEIPDEVILYDNGNNYANFFGNKAIDDSYEYIGFVNEYSDSEASHVRICTTENLHTENYKYLYFQVDSGFHVSGGYTDGVKYSEPIYLYETQDLNKMFTVDFSFVPVRTGSWMSDLTEFSSINRFDINNTIMANGFCIDFQGILSTLAPAPGSSYLQINISKIWLSNLEYS